MQENFAEQWLEDDSEFKREIRERLDKIEQSEMLCRINHLAHIEEEIKAITKNLKTLRKLVLIVGVLLLSHIVVGGGLPEAISLIQTILGTVG